jgi:hypothetical protein
MIYIILLSVFFLGFFFIHRKYRYKKNNERLTLIFAWVGVFCVNIIRLLSNTYDHIAYSRINTITFFILIIIGLTFYIYDKKRKIDQNTKMIKNEKFFLLLTHILTIISIISIFIISVLFSFKLTITIFCILIILIIFKINYLFMQLKETIKKLEILINNSNNKNNHK